MPGFSAIQLITYPFQIWHLSAILLPSIKELASFPITSEYNFVYCRWNINSQLKCGRVPFVRDKQLVWCPWRIEHFDWLYSKHVLTNWAITKHPDILYSKPEGSNQNISLYTGKLCAEKCYVTFKANQKGSNQQISLCTGKLWRDILAPFLIISHNNIFLW